MVRDIFLFPASPPTHGSQQLIPKRGSFPVHSLCAAVAITYQSSNAGPGFQVHKPRISRLTVPKQKKDWTQVPQNEAVLPQGCSAVPPKEIWMQTFHKFPGDKAQSTTQHSDVGWHLLCLGIFPVAQVLDTHRKSNAHLPPPCWALALPQSHIAFLCFFLFLTVGFPH